MPYNLRPRKGANTLVKRPDETILAPRKRVRTKAKLTQTWIDGGDILRKPVARPLGAFETLFNAYPVAQSIVQNLTTPEVMSLCITSPHLWCLLAGNRTFHVFSNHHNCVDLDKPVATLWDYYSTNTFQKFFKSDMDLRRLWSRYLDVRAITQLVLDGSEVQLDMLFGIAAKANISLLSLKFCRKLSLEGINVLLDCPTRHKDFFEKNPLISAQLDPNSTRSLLEDLKTLNIWGVPKTQWVYVPSSYQEDSSLDDAITFTDIRRHCQKKNIELDVSHCHSPGTCIGFQNTMIKWNTYPTSIFFEEQPISEDSVWMCEKKRLQCKCGEIKELFICEDCIEDSYTDSYGFCMTCEKFICESCQVIWSSCEQCGPQCWDCFPSNWHESCTSCNEGICMSHAPNLSRVSQTCNLCDARFCDSCFFQHPHCIIEKCAVCHKMVCDTCLVADFICERCTLSVCKACVKSVDEGVGREKAFAPNARETYKQYDRESSPSMSWCEGKWLCEACLSSVKSRLSLRRSVRTGDRRRSFIWLDGAPSLLGL